LALLRGIEDKIKLIKSNIKLAAQGDIQRANPHLFLPISPKPRQLSQRIHLFYLYVRTDCHLLRIIIRIRNPSSESISSIMLSSQSTQCHEAEGGKRNATWDGTWNETFLDLIRKGINGTDQEEL